MTGPIKPIEVERSARTPKPEFVYGVFNQMLIDMRTVNSKSITLKQDELVRRIITAAPDGTNRNTVFAEKWLDIEFDYRDAGWDVQYHKAEIGQQSESYFIFTPTVG